MGNLKQIKVCVLMYREDNGAWPVGYSQLAAYAGSLSGGDEFNPTKDIFHDAWGNEIAYEPPKTTGQPGRLTSLGSDARPGGEGGAADIQVEFSENDIKKAHHAFSAV
ncbi:MAG: hypothetical protein A3K19_25745 [Lentisphaerae bacterium RIFOXYB12_FULL_65_16]|nr:MAG: hypothetical protein A3K18_03160 [Lentisphaerae bacterium RIFOXYA12_64_32]OGV89553.1 MAG: hypothetical protein A3K19_25745 [Lentisphaerae bacterium RIFOXYB12_FULL_65_16]